MPIEKIRWDKHDVVECDERGRATLGSEYANERIFVYVAEMPDTDELTEPVPDEEQDVLSKMLSWARENDIDTMAHLLDPESGVVIDKQGNRHISPYALAENTRKECPVCDGTGEREMSECSACNGYGMIIISDHTDNND